ncbi:hypothetical protein PanWU01x14_222290 [Parasponia andersonii]|uniref:Uncharacterized protein n=1 Tax=Parasponia andersonii TaxID=3476 RepID=A0A2P5BPJ0_PARAD|nr:hypothetical protein PanWU01x14_222290 [Parasponia andersonii]
MNFDSEQEDANESEVKEGVNQNGGSTRLKVAELHTAMPPWYLEKQARRVRGDFGGKKTKVRGTERDRVSGAEACGDELLGFTPAMQAVQVV